MFNPSIVEVVLVTTVSSSTQLPETCE